jgi:drug/metabolite transporter (DMT)-like permease
MDAGGKQEPRWLLHASMIVLVLFWGLAFVAIKAADEHMSWVTLTFLRFVFADILFLGYLAVRKTERVRPRRQDWLPLLALGFVGFTGYHLFLNLGESNPDVTAGTAALIIASDPAFIALLAVPLLREKLHSLRAAGIGLAFAGLAVMILFAAPGSQLRFSVSLGALEIVPSVVFTAFYLVIGKVYLVRYRPFVFVAYTILLGTVLTVPVVVAVWPTFVSDLASLSWAGLLPVLFLAVCPTFIGYSLWFRAVERMPAAAAGAWLYLSTLIAVVGGILLLQEHVTEAMIVGGAMVISGVIVAQHLGRTRVGAERRPTE